MRKIACIAVLSLLCWATYAQTAFMGCRENIALRIGDDLAVYFNDTPVGALQACDAAQHGAAVTAQDKGRRTAAVEKENHLLARRQCASHLELERARKDRAVACLEFGA